MRAQCLDFLMPDLAACLPVRAQCVVLSEGYSLCCWHSYCLIWLHARAVRAAERGVQPVLLESLVPDLAACARSAWC